VLALTLNVSRASLDVIQPTSLLPPPASCGLPFSFLYTLVILLQPHFVPGPRTNICLYRRYVGTSACHTGKQWQNITATCLGGVAVGEGNGPIQRILQSSTICHLHVEMQGKACEWCKIDKWLFSYVPNWVFLTGVRHLWMISPGCFTLVVRPRQATPI